MPGAATIDLSALPEDQRDAVAASLRENSALREIDARLEHLVAELNHVVHGKKSEKLSEDDRQLAFEDLEVAVGEVEAKRDTQAPSEKTSRRKSPPIRRNRGNLPRQARTAPLVASFGDWLQQSRLRISAKSRLGEKLAYIHRHWDGLQTFLQDGRVEIDSNSVENLIRPIAPNRKNALFAGHDEGGRTWGRIASLIETCKINGVEPFAYLKVTLEAIANGHSQSRIDDLLPWNCQPSS